MSSVTSSPLAGNSDVEFEFEKAGPHGGGHAVTSILRLSEGPDGCICLAQYRDGEGKETSRVCYVVHGKQGGVLVFMQRQIPDPSKNLVSPPEEWFNNSFVELYQRMIGGKESI